MYSRQIDEYEYRNDNRYSSHSVMCAVCSSLCISNPKQSSDCQNYYYYYYCPICGALYYKVFRRYKTSHYTYVIIIFQICCDNDYPEPKELDHFKKDFTTWENDHKNF